MASLVQSLNPFLVFFGAPGVGKGTFSRQVAEKCNMKRIVPGDLLREHTAQKTRLGLAVAEQMAHGDYVSDDVICDIVGDAIPRDGAGAIFDGFPRTDTQVQYLLRIADELQRKIFCINLQMRPDILEARLLGRRVCNACNASYNVCSINDGEYVMEPLLPSQQDLQRCHGCSNLSLRSDDTSETIKKRLKIYHENFTRVQKHLEGVSFTRENHQKVPFINMQIKRGINDLPRLWEMLEKL